MPLPDWPVLVEEFGGGLVRRGFLGPGIGEQAALRHALAPIISA